MKAPRFSLRSLFYLMTVVAVFATLLLFSRQLPDNLQDVVIVLFAISAFLLLGSAVSSLYLHPAGSLVIHLILAIFLFTQSFARYNDVQERTANFASWDGLMMVCLLGAGIFISRQGGKQFREIRDRLAEKE